MRQELIRMVEYGWAQDGARIAWATGVTAGFAVLGYAVHGVSRSGALAGAAVCFALFASAGPGAFVALLTLFVITWTATRVGRARKLRLGTAERGEGRRASQVFANLGVVTVCAVLYAVRGDDWWLVAIAAAMAEAAADTVSSELGQAFSQRALLITSLETVPPGTDGGISIRGTASGVIAAVVMSAMCVVAGLIPERAAAVAAMAGILGMLVDSFLGASFERARQMSNDAVNFLGTATAALAGSIVAGWWS